MLDSDEGIDLKEKKKNNQKMLWNTTNMFR